MSLFRSDLLLATYELPEPVRQAMWLALRSGWYRVRPGSWENEEGVCPFTAAAMVAGVWHDGHVANCGPEWGTEEEPTEAVFEFAVSFDLCAEEIGADRAVQLVLEECARSRPDLTPALAA